MASETQRPSHIPQHVWDAMTPEQQQEAIDNYVRGSVSTPQDSTVTHGTTSGSKSSTKEQETTSSSHSEHTQNSASYIDTPLLTRDANNNVTPESLQAEKDRQAEQIRQAYNLSDAIGANRDKLRAERAREMLQNKKRAKIAAWTDSARVLSDIISAGIGGNVYQRNPDTTAKEAHERNKALRELQAAEDAQAAMQKWQANRDAALAIMQNNQRLDQLAGVQRNAGTTTNNATSESATSGSSIGTSSNTPGATTTRYNEAPQRVTTDRRGAR